MNRRYFYVFAAALVLLVGPGPAQTPSSVPEKYLEGKPVFDFAVLVQGDLRGNFAPCG